MHTSIKTIVTLFFFTFALTAFGQTDTPQILETTTNIQSIEISEEVTEDGVTLNPSNVEDDETILQKITEFEPLIPTDGIKFV